MNDDMKIVVWRWIERANQDLRSARNDLKDDPPITNNACFHTQQCAEKVLKAYLVTRHQHVEKTHDLTDILKKCIQQDSEFFILKDDVVMLNNYAVTTRYPDNWREIPVEEAVEAIENAERIFEFIINKLEKHLGKYEV